MADESYSISVEAIVKGQKEVQNTVNNIKSLEKVKPVNAPLKAGSFKSFNNTAQNSIAKMLSLQSIANSLGRKFGGLGRQLLKLAPALGPLAAAAIAAAVAIKGIEVAITSVVRAFKIGLATTEEYEMSVASLAATVAMMDKTNKNLSIGEQYKLAKQTVETELMPALADLANVTALTPKQAVQIGIEFAKSGIVINAQNQKQIQGVQNLAAAFSVYLGESANEMQIRSEMNQLLSGTINQTSTLGTILKKQTPDIEEQLKLHVQQGDIAEFIGEQFASLGPAAEDVAKTWTSVKDTLDSTVNSTLRQGIEPAYKTLVNLTDKFNNYLQKNPVILESIKNLFGLIANIVNNFVVPAIKSIMPTIEFVLEALNWWIKFFKIITTKGNAIYEIFKKWVEILTIIPRMLTNILKKAKGEEPVNLFTEFQTMELPKKKAEPIKPTPIAPIKPVVPMGGMQPITNTSAVANLNQVTVAATQANQAITQVSTNANNKMSENSKKVLLDMQAMGQIAKTDTKLAAMEASKVFEILENKAKEAQQKVELAFVQILGKTKQQVSAEEAAALQIEQIRQNQLQSQLERITTQYNQAKEASNLSYEDELNFVNQIVSLQEELTNFKIAQSERTLSKLSETADSSVNIEKVAAAERTRINKEAADKIIKSIGDVKVSMIDDLKPANAEVTQGLQNIAETAKNSGQTISESMKSAASTMSSSFKQAASESKSAINSVSNASVASASTSSISSTESANTESSAKPLALQTQKLLEQNWGDPISAFVKSKANEIQFLNQSGQIWTFPKTVAQAREAQLKAESMAIEKLIKTQSQFIRTSQDVDRVIQLLSSNSAQMESLGFTAGKSAREINNLRDRLNNLIQGKPAGLGSAAFGRSGETSGRRTASQGGGIGSGGGNVSVKITNNISTPDVSGFAQSEDQLSNDMKNELKNVMGL